jgi:hypothetical protein
MPTTTQETLVAETQEQFLRAIEQAQDASIRFASLLAEQSPRLPTPAQAVESGFAFAGRVLELQKRYALGFVGAVAPPEPAKKG